MIYDVLIVGAGVAGLAAAQDLLANGITNILVIEAQDYVGGRVKTWEGWTGPIELGAELIHGNHTATWQYVTELNLPVVPARGEARLIGPTGIDITIRQRQEFDSLMESLSEHGESGVSVARQIEASEAEPLIKQLAKVSVGDYEAGDADRLDSGAFARMCQLTKGNGDNYILTGGYQPIVKRLAKDVPIRLQAVVKAIDLTSPQTMIVTLADGEVLRAKKCIVTVSVGVLKNNDILFTPSLPAATQTSVDKIGMGNVMKLILRFRTPEIVRQLFAYADGESTALQTVTNWWASAADPNVLVGYCGGSRAAATLAMSADELLTKVTTDLSMIAGRELRDDILDYKVSRWDDNPFTRGGYSNYPVGVSLEDRTALMQPIDGRLFFAGEAVSSNGNYATVHGAIESGCRASSIVLDRLK